MANKLAHLVVENNTYDIQDEELTNKFDGMTIELALSNDYVITATLKDGNNTTLSTATIDLPSENSLVSLDYDNTTNEIIGIYRDDTVAVPHRIRVELDNLQEKLTAGQNISIINNTVSLLGIGEASTETVTGIATLDSYGKVPSSQLPSYVDDVLEYSTLQDFPVTGEAGKIYVTLDTNKTYRWTGSVYVEISKGVVLGETEYTAYRGDRGKIAYDHAIAKGSAYANGLYKITTNSEGHVTSATTVQKTDITSLGIPAQDTTYNSGVATEIDNNNNVNVKYDSDTLEVDSQNRLKVKSSSQTFNFNEAIENVNGTVNVRYKGVNWDIGRDSQTNQLTINGKFVKQVEDLDAYTDAPDGEIVEYIGETDENYTNGYFYKFHQGSSTAEYETITIPANKTYITYHFPDGTEETGYEFSDERYEIGGEWMRNLHLNVISSDNGTYLNGDKWNVFLPISKTGDLITYDEQYVGQIESVIVEVNNPNASLEDYIQIYNYSATIECSSLQNAIDIYKTLCDEHNLEYSPYNSTYFRVKGINVINDNNHYQITSNGSASGIGEGHALQLISLTGKILLLESDNYLTNHVATEVREGGIISLLNDGTTESYDETNNVYYYNNPHYNPPTIATRGTTTEPITLTVPILYNEDGTLKDIETTPSYWQRIDVQPNVQPNNGSLTIQQNGTNVVTFNANDATDKVANIQTTTITFRQWRTE